MRNKKPDTQPYRQTTLRRWLRGANSGEKEETTRKILYAEEINSGYKDKETDFLESKRKQGSEDISENEGFNQTQNIPEDSETMHLTSRLTGQLEELIKPRKVDT